MTNRMLCVLLWAGCAIDGGDKSDVIAVNEPNDLGVAALHASRSEIDGNTVFTLRGFTADGTEVASVRLTTGVLPNVSVALPAADTDVASEIVFLAADSTARLVTRETELFEVDPARVALPIAHFLDIGAVRSTLASDANIIVDKLATETPYSNILSGSCNQGPFGSYNYMLNQTPVAHECCFDETNYNSSSQRDDFNLVFSMDNQAVGTKKRNMQPWGLFGNPCTASNGTSSCNGASCYYGPLGFARPVVWTPFAPLKIHQASNGAVKCIQVSSTLGGQLTIQPCSGGGEQNWTAISGGRLQNNSTGWCAAVDSTGWARVITKTCSTTDPSQVFQAYSVYGVASTYAQGQIMTTAGSVLNDGWGVVTNTWQATVNWETHFTYASVNSTQFTTCGASWADPVVASPYVDTTGTAANGQGCPGGQTGAGQWDF